MLDMLDCDQLEWQKDEPLDFSLSFTKGSGVFDDDLHSRFVVLFWNSNKILRSLKCTADITTIQKAQLESLVRCLKERETD